ncbi:hypothetical protein ABE073_04170 [Lederbergia citrisecunda]|uniref:hypothetical protein n=1 Tax=Lederbergia citrisecunda TaxID=2833583 RepID=UPI003D2CB4AB
MSVIRFKQHHTATHTALQSITNPSQLNGKSVHTNSSEDTVDMIQDELIYAIMKQSSIFAAMNMINETNRLNGYKVVSDYDVTKIKMHFLKNKNRNGESSDFKKGENESGNRQRGNMKNAEIKKRDYQKAFMQLLSNYKTSI